MSEHEQYTLEVIAEGVKCSPCDNFWLVLALVFLVATTMYLYHELMSLRKKVKQNPINNDALVSSKKHNAYKGIEWLGADPNNMEKKDDEK